jgi:hypothetical protein
VKKACNLKEEMTLNLREEMTGISGKKWVEGRNGGKLEENGGKFEENGGKFD